jgi:hypothetical protein
VLHDTCGKAGGSGQWHRGFVHVCSDQGEMRHGPTQREEATSEGRARSGRVVWKGGPVGTLLVRGILVGTAGHNVAGAKQWLARRGSGRGLGKGALTRKPYMSVRRGRGRCDADTWG